MCRVGLCFTITKFFALFYQLNVFLFCFFFNPYLFFLSWGGVEEEKGSSLALSCFFHTIIYDVGHEEMHEGQEGERSAGMRSSRVTHVDQTCCQGTREGTSG